MKKLGKKAKQLIYFNKDFKIKQSKHQGLISTFKIIKKIFSFKL